MSDGIVGILVIFLIICVYMLPTILAQGRKHKALAQIGILNVLLGWLVIGWVVALIWAYSDNVQKVEK